MADNPFANPGKWTEIHTSVIEALITDGLLNKNDKISDRQSRDRFTNLLTKFSKDELASLKASGSAEEFDERRRLLTELSEMRMEADNTKERKRKRELEKENMGIVVREAAMQRLKRAAESDSDSEEPWTSTARPKAKQARRAELMEFLKQRHEDEKEIRLRELEFEKEKHAAEVKEKARMMDLLAALLKDRQGQK